MDESSARYVCQDALRGEFEAAVVDRLSTLRGPGESYSDVILRLIELGAGIATQRALTFVCETRAAYLSYINARAVQSAMVALLEWKPT